MPSQRKLGKYSLGVGDRFAHQAPAQLDAFIRAAEEGVDITPVWNKSYREHTTIHSRPSETRRMADEAVRLKGWQGSYFVDADHVGMATVDLFIDNSDFFTLDVADAIGQQASEEQIDNFVDRCRDLTGRLDIPGIEEIVEVDTGLIRAIARKYLHAVKQAAGVYRHIRDKKSDSGFIIEVSMDETDDPQGPVDILFILAALAQEDVPVATLAPKFSGRFNKGVDYRGDLDRFESEFRKDVAVLNWAQKSLGLPEGLKLSVHSGSDKFSIYPIMQRVVHELDAGLHLKTAGTTWLEELIGLAEAGGSGLDLAVEIYSGAYRRRDELCRPYAAVIDIDENRLPDPDTVDGWSSQDYVAALRHDPENPAFNPGFRQLLHVGYKIAAELGEKYYHALDEFRDSIARNVTMNIYERHISKLFLDKK